MTGVLSRRELNRAVLCRQLLLGRQRVPVVDAVARVLGLNAQDVNIAYLALWSRLHPFAVADLTAALEDGSVVRSTTVRATQHVVTAGDLELVRPAVAPLLRRVQRNGWGSRTSGVDLDELVRDARRLLAGGRVLTRPELGRRLTASRPGADPTALGWTVQYLVPVVHPAPSGTWDVRGHTPFLLAGARSGRDATEDDLREFVRRYLAAFGPATVSDVRSWSGVAGLARVVTGMRGELCAFTDERGRELYDLPDAPRPPADTPAPVRLLPEFDEPLLAYADRTRLMTDEVRRQVCVGSGVAATVLVDGFVSATWTLSRTDEAAEVTVHPLRRLAGTERAEIEAEAHALLAFAAPTTADRRVVFA